ncbi:MAG TPA: UV DNA damage repair endonuclease UvsE [Solirubrobacteraceae bacterium]|nr:UV DNA damage repair endonuclease UvsE [Solirubrobacteraceae bacterium]
MRERAPAATSHRLGFAVKVLGDGGLPSHDTRRWGSGPHLRDSLQRLRAVFDYLDRHDVRMYRMATALAPYASHPELTQFHGQVAECAGELAEVGQVARARDIRLSTHPGQYTVLNSEDPGVRSAAVAELEVQASLLDAMGLGPEAVVVLHVGGVAGGKAAACDRFLAGFERLSESARARLTIENDDRSFGTTDVVGLARRAGIRVVWDVLHHRCNDPDGLDDREALAAALGTWPRDTVPKIHYSSPRLDVEERKVREGRRVTRRLVLPQLRAHADLVDPIGFEHFLRDARAGRDFDVMLEAKAKDLALRRLREQLEPRGLRGPAGRVVVPASS